MKFGIVVGRFNDLVTKLLLEGALEDFERHGLSREDVDNLWQSDPAASNCSTRLVLWTIPSTLFLRRPFLLECII